MKTSIGYNDHLDLEEGKEVMLRGLDSISDEEIIAPHNGYGKCSSCNCQGYIPNNPKNDFCKNCSHHWSRHGW